MAEVNPSPSLNALLKPWLEERGFKEALRGEWYKGKLKACTHSVKILSSECVLVGTSPHDHEYLNPASPTFFEDLEKWLST